MYGRGKTRTVFAVAVTLPLLVGISSPSIASTGDNPNQISVTGHSKDQISVTGKGQTKDQISVTGTGSTDQISVTNKGKGKVKDQISVTSTKTTGKGQNKGSGSGDTSTKGGGKTKGGGNTKGGGKTKGGSTTTSPTLSLVRTLNMPTASTLGYNPGATNTYTGAVLCSTGKLCPAGRTIWDIEFDANGNLVAGYGDYDTNVDSFGNKAVAIEAVNPETGALAGSSIPVGSEAFDNIKKIDGALYIPTTDPSDRNGKSGVWTNRSGSWEFISSGEPMTHVFDVEVLGDNIYMAGSIGHSAVIIGGPIDGAKNRLFENAGEVNRVYSIEALDSSNLIFSGYFGGGSPAVLNVDTNTVKHLGLFADHTDRMLDWNSDVIEWQTNYGRLMTLTATGQDHRFQGITNVYSAREVKPFVGDDNKLYVVDGAGGLTVNIWSYADKSAAPVKVGTISGKTHNDLSGAGAVKDGKLYLGTTNGTVKVFQL